MFIRQQKYIELVAQASKHEAENAFLLARVNQLELENGHLRAELTGKPQVVPTIKKFQATPTPEAQDVEQFEDLGDELARKHGVDWPETAVLTK